MWNKTERTGTVDQAMGKVKQAVGTLIGDDTLNTEGRVDEAVGKTETTVGHAVRTLDDAVTRAGKAVKGA